MKIKRKLSQLYCMRSDSYFPRESAKTWNKIMMREASHVIRSGCPYPIKDMVKLQVCGIMQKSCMHFSLKGTTLFLNHISK